MISKDNWKQILISIFVGACVAFFSTLFTQLAEFFRAYSTEMISGGTTSFYYLVKNFRA